MSEASKPSVDEQACEDDLENLLDNALSDFDKPLPKTTAVASTSSAPAAAEPQKEKPSQADAGNQWSSEFKQFENVMEAFLKDPKQELPDMGVNSEEFSACLSETLKAITECTNSLPEPTPEELAQLFGRMTAEDGESLGNSDQIPDIVPMMQNAMQSLLSKELLYPALKDLVSKYPSWLDTKRETLDRTVFDKYSKQYELMKQVCEEFESRTLDSEEAKTQSFQKVLMLMQQMQECGNPPQELIGDVSQELPLDEQGNFKLPGMPEQCTVM